MFLFKKILILIKFNNIPKYTFAPVLFGVWSAIFENHLVFFEFWIKIPTPISLNIMVKECNK